MTNLLGDRVKRPAVSIRDGEEAIQTLRSLGRVNVDEYLQNIDPEKLLNGPVGPTPECLTLDQLDQYSQVALSAHAVPHLLSCSHCREALRVYKRVRERALKAGDPVTEAIFCESLHAIKLIPGIVQFDLQLSSTAALADGVQLSAPEVFETLRCESIQPISQEPLVGMIYRARCEGRLSTRLVRSLAREGEFLDWIRVSGSTSAGQPFVVSDLARFQIQKELQKVG